MHEQYMLIVTYDRALVAVKPVKDKRDGIKKANAALGEYLQKALGTKFDASQFSHNAESDTPYARWGKAGDKFLGAWASVDLHEWDAHIAAVQTSAQAA